MPRWERSNKGVECETAGVMREWRIVGIIRVVGHR